MSRLAYFFATVFLLVGHAAAQQPEAVDPSQAVPQSTHYLPIKITWGNDRREAIQAQEHADLLRSAFENNRRAQKSSLGKKERADLIESRFEAHRKSLQRGPNHPIEAPSAPLTPELEAEAEHVIRAYQEVINRFPHTQHAAYCAIRLSGMYCMALKPELARELLESSAVEFTGTREGMQVLFSTGLFHLQSRNDPRRARDWLTLIPRPLEATDNLEYESDLNLYISAQEHIVKCELRLGLMGEAETRTSELKRSFPRYADGLDRFHEFEIKSLATMQRPLKPNPRARYLFLGHLLIVIGSAAFMLIRHLSAMHT